MFLCKSGGTCRMCRSAIYLQYLQITQFNTISILTQISSIYTQAPTPVLMYFNQDYLWMADCFPITALRACSLCSHTCSCSNCSHCHLDIAGKSPLAWEMASAFLFFASPMGCPRSIHLTWLGFLTPCVVAVPVGQDSALHLQDG